MQSCNPRAVITLGYANSALKHDGRPVRETLRRSGQRLCYFLERYASINLAAPYFAWGFAAQAVLIAVSGILMGRLAFNNLKSLAGKLGFALFLFAILLQPLMGPLIGREWSGMKLFGLAPDPTVLATLGVLVAADRIRLELFVIPLLWCATTGATLWTMGSPEVLLMPTAGLSTLILATYRSLSSLPPHKSGHRGVK